MGLQVWVCVAALWVGVCWCVCISAYVRSVWCVDCGSCVIWCWRFGLWGLVCGLTFYACTGGCCGLWVWVIAPLPECSGFWVGWVWIWCTWIVVGLGLDLVGLGFAYAECFGVWGLGFRCGVVDYCSVCVDCVSWFLAFWFVVGWYNIGFGCWFWIVSIVGFGLFSGFGLLFFGFFLPCWQCRFVCILLISWVGFGSRWGGLFASSCGVLVLLVLGMVVVFRLGFGVWW